MRNKFGLTGQRAVARSCDLEIKANMLAMEEVRSYLQALRQMRDGRRGLSILPL